MPSGHYSIVAYCHGFWGRFVKSLQDTASRRFSVAFHGLGNGRRLF